MDKIKQTALDIIDIAKNIIAYVIVTIMALFGCVLSFVLEVWFIALLVIGLLLMFGIIKM